MSNIVPPQKRKVLQGRRVFSIVAARFNGSYVQGLIRNVTQELRSLLPAAQIRLYRVPGAFEIPVVVREIALRRNTDAIIAIGVILKGRTSHAEHLGRTVTDALQRIAIEYGVPVINVVLSLENELQAHERCLEKTMNRGTEAAHAALEIVDVMSKLQAKRAK